MSGHNKDEPASRGNTRTRDGPEGVRLRLIWPDFARAGTIIAVVLLHVCRKHYFELDWSTLEEESTRQAWATINYALTPFRLPIFFAISGFLASSALHRQWRLVILRRIAAPFYFYAIWLIINAATYWLLKDSSDNLLVQGIGDLLSRLWLPTSTLWYLYALVLFFVAARLFMRFPTGIVLAGTSLLSASVAAGWLQPTEMYASISQNLIFYLVGAYFPTWIKRAATEVDARSVGITMGALAAVAIAFAVGMYDRIFGSRVVVGLAAIWIVVVSAGLLSRGKLVPRWATYVGRNTLPVLVMHGPLIALFSWLSAGPGAKIWTDMLQTDVARAIYPALMCAIIVALTLAIHRLLLLAKCHWLFRFPYRRSKTSHFVWRTCRIRQ